MRASLWAMAVMALGVPSRAQPGAEREFGQVWACRTRAGRFARKASTP